MMAICMKELSLDELFHVNRKNWTIHKEAISFGFSIAVIILPFLFLNYQYSSMPQIIK